VTVMSRFTGRLTAVRVTPAGLFGTIGEQDQADQSGVQSKSYLRMRGGTVMFAKLTMRDTDMTMVQLDAGRHHGFFASSLLHRNGLRRDDLAAGS
jgi:hypothetical protein